MPNEDGNPTAEDEARASGIDVDALREAVQAAEESGTTLQELMEWYEAEHGERWPVFGT